MSKNRFEQNKINPLTNLVYLLPLLGFIALFILFFRGISSVSDTNTAKQMESLQNALNRSITQCYAVEGAYPPNLAYIREHYGLIYDEDLFYVDYQPIGSNIMPDVTILLKSGGTP